MNTPPIDTGLGAFRGVDWALVLELAGGLVMVILGIAIWTLTR
jgi:hypothetical protein